MGQFILTGSHQLELNEAISQSLAGRTALLNLYPMSIEELSNNNVFMTRDEYLISGFMPAVHKGKWSHRVTTETIFKHTLNVMSDV